MSEYAVSIFAICLVVGLASALSYGLGGAERIALGIITLYVVIAPVVSMISEFDPEGWLQSVNSSSPEIDEEYTAVVEEAFAEGICLAVADKFSFERENVRVRLFGFDFQKMRCERIRITLSGRAALSDYKAVERYVNGLDYGECEVEIEIG